jgi:hypothetical protein
MTILLNVAAAVSLLAQTAPEHSLRLTSPAPGEELHYYSWEISITVGVIAPPGDYEVELTYQGTTHFLPALKAYGRVDESGLESWSLVDYWLKPELGEHPVELRLLSLTDTGIGASGRLLARNDDTITYSYREDDPPEKQARDQMRYLARNAIQRAERLDPVERSYVSSDGSEAGERRAHAEAWIDARHGWLSQRLKTLAKIAELYDYTGRAGDGLLALQRAEALWKAESTEILHREPASPFPIKWQFDGDVGVPPHLLALAGFYGRRLESERAVEYLKEGIAFMGEQQRKHPRLEPDDRRYCENIASGLMGRVAMLHYLVTRDRAGYELWKQRSKDTYARSQDKSRDGGLLGR